MNEGGKEEKTFRVKNKFSREGLKLSL